MEKGDWVLRERMIIRSTESIGFKMTDTNMFQNMSFPKCELEVDEKWTKLIDGFGRQVYKVETGLLSTDEKVPAKHDFRVFGLKLSDILSIGAMNQNFHVLYKNRDTLLSVLNDLDVPKPIISDLTKESLKLWDWDTTREHETDENVELEDATDLVTQLITHEFKDDLTLMFETDDKALQDYIDFIIKTDSIQSMNTSVRVQQSRKLFNKIQNLKYDLIASQVLIELKINKQIIAMCSKFFQGKARLAVNYSLISLFDRTFFLKEHVPLANVTMNISMEFNQKFQNDSVEIDF